MLLVYVVNSVYQYVSVRCMVQCLYEGSNIDVVYVDFAKAFDKVDHGVLAFKLRSLGIIGNLGSWLYEFVIYRA